MERRQRTARKKPGVRQRKLQAGTTSDEPFGQGWRSLSAKPVHTFREERGIAPGSSGAGSIRMEASASVREQPNGICEEGLRLPGRFREETATRASALRTSFFRSGGGRGGFGFRFQSRPARQQVRLLVQPAPGRSAACRWSREAWRREGFGRRAEGFPTQLAGLALQAAEGKPEGRGGFGQGVRRARKWKGASVPDRDRMETGCGFGRAAIRTEPPGLRPGSVPKGKGGASAPSPTRPGDRMGESPCANHPPSGTPRRQAGHGAGTVGAGGDTSPHYVSGPIGTGAGERPVLSFGPFLRRRYPASSPVSVVEPEQHLLTQPLETGA
jgi:hypothetical protein